MLIETSMVLAHQHLTANYLEALVVCQRLFGHINLCGPRCCSVRVSKYCPNRIAFLETLWIDQYQISSQFRNMRECVDGPAADRAGAD
jgi:hypothetical protein